MTLTTLFEEFVTIWVVVDPIGTIPVFLAFTGGMAAKQRNKVALQAVAVSTGVLVFFIVCGQMLMDALGISLLSFRIAGGIIMFIFALTMVFGESKPESEIESGRGSDQNVAVYPLAVPSIASPGAMMTVVVLTDNNRFSVPEQSLTALMMLLVLAATFVLLLLANPIYRVIRESGASIVSRVMGMILAAVAVDIVLEGLELRFLQP